MRAARMMSRMKWICCAVVICVTALTLAHAAEDDPCRDKQSNVDKRLCYTQHQTKVNTEADSLAQAISIGLRKEADSQQATAPPAASELRKAASALTRSQRAWRTYRDQYCKAIMRWIIGSGGGTVHEKCMYILGRQRVDELHSDFPE